MNFSQINPNIRFLSLQRRRDLSCSLMRHLRETRMSNRPPRFLIMVTLTIFIFIAAAALLIVQRGTSLKQVEAAR